MPKTATAIPPHPMTDHRDRSLPEISEPTRRLKDETAKEFPMARNESDREDLIREAVGLPQRVEFKICWQPEPMFVGFRADDSLSIYFGQHDMLQFNSANELKRAFADGYLYRTQGHTLARLERVRTTSTSELRRLDLDASELAQFLGKVREKLLRLRESFAAREHTLLRAVPTEDGDDLMQRVLGRIDTILQVDCKLAPAFAGRR